MTRVCSWCETEMGTFSSDETADDEVTHGICLKCACELSLSELIPLKIENFPIKIAA